MFWTYYLRVYTEDPPFFLVSGMVTGRQCSWHTGRNKLKLGSEIQNPLLNSRELVLQGEKAKLTNNGCTCCKFIFPSSSSPLPATKNRKLRSEECVLHRCHVTWFLNDEVLLLFENFKQLPPAVPSWGFKCKDAWCTFKQLSCLQKKMYYNRLCVIAAKWIHWQ